MILVGNIKKIINAFYNRYQCRKKGVVVLGKPVINGIIKIYGKGEIHFGDNVRINSGEKYNPIGGTNRTIISLRNNGVIMIGDNVGISNSAFVAREKIIIENNVLIGGNCVIYDNDFHSLDLNTRKGAIDNDIHSEAVKICNGAFIGAHTIILKGVIIGEQSIIGAGSVVTKSVPSGEIWAGNPATFIKKVTKK